MRSNKYAIARLNHKVTFGHEGSTGKKNPNTGKAIKGFVGDVTVHCGNYSMSASQTISLAGSTIQDTVMIVVRHNPKLQQYKEAKYNDIEYTVSNWSLDDEINAYDLITLTKKNSHG